MHGEHVYGASPTRLGPPGDPQRPHTWQVQDRHSWTENHQDLAPYKIRRPQSHSLPQAHHDGIGYPSSARRSGLVQENMRENEDLRIWTPERGPRMLRHPGWNSAID